MRVTMVIKVKNSMTSQILRMITKTRYIFRNKKKSELNFLKTKNCKKRREENRGRSKKLSMAKRESRKQFRKSLREELGSTRKSKNSET